MQVVFVSTHLCSSTFIIILTEACSLSPQWWFNCQSNFNQEPLEELCAFWQQELWSKHSFPPETSLLRGDTFQRFSSEVGLQCQTKFLRIFSYILNLWALLLTWSVIQYCCFELMVKTSGLMTWCRPCGSGDDIQPLDKIVQKIKVCHRTSAELAELTVPHQ